MSDAATQAPPPPPKPLVVAFSGPMAHSAVKFVRNWCTVAATRPAFTLLLNSDGGSLTDGWGLYHLIRAIPCEVTAVNAGTVGSISVAVFLAAERRIACPNTRFILHDFTWTFPERETLSTDLIAERAEYLAYDKRRYRELLVERTNLTDPRLDELNLFQEPIIIDAPTALEMGIVHDIAQYTFPAGAEIRNMDF